MPARICSASGWYSSWNAASLSGASGEHHPRCAPGARSGVADGCIGASGVRASSDAAQMSGQRAPRRRRLRIQPRACSLQARRPTRGATVQKPGGRLHLRCATLQKRGPDAPRAQFDCVRRGRRICKLGGAGCTVHTSALHLAGSPTGDSYAFRRTQTACMATSCAQLWSAHAAEWLCDGLGRSRICELGCGCRASVGLGI